MPLCIPNTQCPSHDTGHTIPMCTLHYAMSSAYHTTRPGGRVRTPPIMTVFIPGTPLQTTPLQKRA